MSDFNPGPRYTKAPFRDTRAIKKIIKARNKELDDAPGGSSHGPVVSLTKQFKGMKQPKFNEEMKKV